MNTRKATLTVLSITFKIVITALIIMGILRLGTMAYNYGHSVFQETAVDEEPGRQVEVSIPAGSSEMAIGKILEKKGLVEDWKLFYLQVTVSKYRGKLQPGQYILSTAMKPRAMMAIMSGEAPEEPEQTEEES